MLTAASGQESDAIQERVQSLLHVCEIETSLTRHLTVVHATVSGQELRREALGLVQAALEYLKAEQDFPPKNERVPAARSIQAFLPNWQVAAGAVCASLMSHLRMVGPVGRRSRPLRSPAMQPAGSSCP